MMHGQVSVVIDVISYSPIIQNLQSGLFVQKNVTVDVLRLDLVHPEVSGNKWFKLKRNLEEARKGGHRTILTFGGAFSNHIHATAAACKVVGFDCIGVIRGEESDLANDTLGEAARMGMRLYPVSREDYRRKEDSHFIGSLKEKFGDFYRIPEGGNNALGIEGCSGIITKDMDHKYIFCAVGTGATFNGIKAALKQDQKLTGIRVLKGYGEEKNILDEYHFGGYAKHTPELLEFKRQFETEFHIPLDYVYTAKLFFAVLDLLKRDKIAPGSRLLVIHSGGLQGNKGYEKRYSLKPSL